MTKDNRKTDGKGLSGDSGSSAGANKKGYNYKTPRPYPVKWAVVSERLREAREAAGLTQAEAEEKTGVNRVYMSDWERMEATPGAVEALYNMARAYGVTMDWIFGDSEVPVRPSLKGIESPEALEMARIAEKLSSQSRIKMLNAMRLEQEADEKLLREKEAFVGILLDILADYATTDESVASEVEAALNAYDFDLSDAWRRRISVARAGASTDADQN